MPASWQGQEQNRVENGGSTGRSFSARVSLEFNHGGQGPGGQGGSDPNV